jgi:hypothetical protein
MYRAAVRRRSARRVYRNRSRAIAVMLGCAHAFVTGAAPHPVGLYLATIGTAVAVLWRIARAFQPPR